MLNTKLAQHKNNATNKLPNLNVEFQVSDAAGA